MGSVDEVNKAINTGKAMETLGNCDQCNAPKIMSKKGNVYCSAKCWLAPNPKKGYDESEQAFIASLPPEDIPIINQ